MNFGSRTLLGTTAIVEAVAGIGLLAAPSLVVSVLLGGSLEGATGTIAARLAGAALGALAIACGFASRGERGPAERGLIAGVLFYNLATVGLLLTARFRFGMDGVGLFPAAALHLALAFWCLASIRPKAGAE